MASLYALLPFIVFGAALWLIKRYIWLPDDAMAGNKKIERDRAGGAALIVVLMCAVSGAGMAQTPEALDVNGKLRFQAGCFSDPWPLVGPLAYAGILQGINSPREWGQGGAGYGKRVGSTVGTEAIYGFLAVGLDSTLHQDPRYYRSLDSGFWRRTGHALRGTILTHKDPGGETLSTWRLGAAYGSAFLSNQWMPNRLNTAPQGFLDGSMQLGMDFGRNLSSEFWPDIKRKLLHRKPSAVPVAEVAPEKAGHE
jgi:hypothetical protein